MRILEKFGWTPDTTEPFWYRRESTGILIQNVTRKDSTFIENEDWNRLLSEIETAKSNIFSATSKEENLNSLYELAKSALKKAGKTGKIEIDTVDASAVLRILFHEGTIDFYQGVLGPARARMYLQRSKKQ